MDRDGLRAKGGGSVGMGFGMSGVWLGVGDWEPGDWGVWGIHRNGIWDEWGFGWVSEMGDVEINWIWGLGGSIGMGFGMSGGWLGVRDRRLSGFGVWGGP